MHLIIFTITEKVYFLFDLWVKILRCI